MSGNFAIVREMAGNWPFVSELSGNVREKTLSGKTVTVCACYG